MTGGSTRKAVSGAGSAAGRQPGDHGGGQDREHAEAAIETFVELFGAKYPKAVAKIVDDREQLLAFYDFPAEHWVHLKTSNPIESTFATVRLRTKGPGQPGRRAGHGVQAAAGRRGALALRQRRPPGRPRPRAGAKFEKGVLVERPEQAAQEDAA